MKTCDKLYRIEKSTSSCRNDGGMILEEYLTEIIVESEDIDLLNHVNNIAYIKFFEIARFNWYRKNGIHLKELMKCGKAFVVRNLDVSYHDEARLGDRLKIKTIPYKLGNSSFTFKQYIYNEQNKLITEAKVVSVMIDLEKRKSIPVIEEIAKHFY